MDIKESVHQILGNQELLADLFYCLFLDRYPEVRRHFQGVDLKYQAAHTHQGNGISIKNPPKRPGLFLLAQVIRSQSDSRAIDALRAPFGVC
jgi:hypothetical protein